MSKARGPVIIVLGLCSSCLPCLLVSSFSTHPTEYSPPPSRPNSTILITVISVQTQPESPCPHCGGSGWRPEPRDPDQDQDKAQSRSLPKVVPCDCRNAARNQYALEKANVPGRFADKNFENYQDDTDDEEKRESLARARSAARRFAKDYPALTRTGLLFYGQCGTGKTHLSIAIAKELLAKGVDVYYCNVTDFLGQLRHSYNPSTQAIPQEILNRAIQAEVLILDDLGAERLTDWVQETIYDVINQRYQNGYGALIITTNHVFAPPTVDKDESRSRSLLTKDKEAEQAERAMAREPLGDRVGTRIYSRLQELCRVRPIYADDFRATIPKR